jgi:hypothetical protein
MVKLLEKVRERISVLKGSESESRETKRITRMPALARAAA